MENRISTEEAQIFLTEYYKRYDIFSQKDDWELLKKYKNFKGLTCRDFTLKTQDKTKPINCIVVYDNRTTFIQVIEDQNYEYFVKQAANSPVFYYVPTICNDGLVFYFETVAQIDRFGTPAAPEDNAKFKEMLHGKLAGLLGNANVFSLSNGLFFSFPLTEMEHVIAVLEKNYCKYNMELFDYLDQEKYQPIYPDVDIVAHRFPDDLKKSPEEVINTFLEICSLTTEWTSKEYARVKNLIKHIKINDEFIACLNIVNGWDCANDGKLQDIFNNEIIRRKNMEFVHDIWVKKKKPGLKQQLDKNIEQPDDLFIEDNKELPPVK